MALQSSMAAAAAAGDALRGAPPYPMSARTDAHLTVSAGAQLPTCSPFRTAGDGARVVWPWVVMVILA